MTNRGLVVLAAAVALLGGGLLALGFPVFIDAYDHWGSQVECGSGFNAELSQAEQQAGGGNEVSLCEEALAFRRAWAIPTTTIGLLILTALAVPIIAHDHPKPALPVGPSPVTGCSRTRIQITRRMIDLKMINPLVGRPFRPLLQFLTLGFLAPAFREALGLSWSQAQQRRFELLFLLVAFVNRFLPLIYPPGRQLPVAGRCALPNPPHQTSCLTGVNCEARHRFEERRRRRRSAPRSTGGRDGAAAPSTQLPAKHRDAHRGRAVARPSLPRRRTGVGIRPPGAGPPDTNSARKGVTGGRRRGGVWRGGGVRPALLLLPDACANR